jgi:hypothetical protein
VCEPHTQQRPCKRSYPLLTCALLGGSKTTVQLTGPIWQLIGSKEQDAHRTNLYQLIIVSSTAPLQPLLKKPLMPCQPNTRTILASIASMMMIQKNWNSSVIS